MGPPSLGQVVVYLIIVYAKCAHGFELGQVMKWSVACTYTCTCMWCPTGEYFSQFFMLVQWSVVDSFYVTGVFL